MKRSIKPRLLIAAALALGISVSAQAAEPPCWPTQISDVKQGSTPDGVWYGWKCDGKTWGVYAVTGYQIKHPDLEGKSMLEAPAAYWAANVSDVGADDPRLQRLRTAMIVGMR